MQFDAPVPGTYDLPAFGAAANGNVLTDEGAVARQLADFYGDKYVVLSFIYTQCADLNGCPLVTAVFYKIKQRLTEQEPQLAGPVKINQSEL